MDMDGDRIAELLVKNPANGKVYVFNGRDGTLKLAFTGPKTHPFTQVALGGVDKNGFGDVFVAGTDSKIHRFEYGTRPFQ
jgi:hypothetical protein